MRTYMHALYIHIYIYTCIYCIRIQTDAIHQKKVYMEQNTAEGGSLFNSEAQRSAYSVYLSLEETTAYHDFGLYVSRHLKPMGWGSGLTGPTGTMIPMGVSKHQGP